MLTETMSTASRLVSGLLEKTSGVHAVLIYGAEGARVEELARYLAAGWLCHNLGTGPCGTCRSCQALERNSHADLFLVKPKGRSSIISVKQITERPKKPGEEPEYPIQDFFRTPPLFGARKVGIIEDANRMGGEAVSALLKTLEEPNDYAKVILTTHALSGIYPTVISRCVAIPCHLSTEDDVPDVPAGLEKIVDRIGQRGAGSALRISDEFRELCGKVEGEEEGGSRAANTKAVAELARLLLRRYPNRPEWTQAAIEAHRRIIGNAQAGLVFDALFAKLTVDSTRTA